MRLSAIIPTLNEEARIGELVSSLLAQGAIEAIVADGGSEDATLEAAQRAGARIVRAPQGRGAQLRAGARLATGDALLFVHADSRLAPQALAAIADALSRPDVVGGSFRLAFDARHPVLALLSELSRLNHALATFGDQGLFVRRGAYEAVGGYAALPILEDFEIQRRLRAMGRFAKLPLPIVTSARRFLRDGVVRRQLANCLLVLAYLAGVAPERLAHYYRPEPALRRGA